MNNSGFIKIYRSLLDWEWYNDVNVCRLFTHLLLTVNYEDGRYMGRQISRGCRVATLPILASESNLTVQQVRTALSKLKLTGELTVKKTPQFSIISVSNYDRFQTLTGTLTVEQQSSNRTSTVEQQSSNRDTILKKERSKESKKLRSKVSTSPQATLAPDNRTALVAEYGETNVKIYEQKFATWCSKRKVKNADAFTTISRWLSEDKPKKEQQSSFDVVELEQTAAARYQKRTDEEEQEGNDEKQ